MDPLSSNSPEVQPVTLGPAVFYRGRHMFRVRGAESDGPPAAADVGGDGGDAGQGEGLGLYDLSAAPEALRPALEQELKKIEANATRKFQEHADYRKRFEPFEGIEGLSDVPADELTELVQFRQVLANQEQFEQWWHQIGNELGFLGESGPEGEGDDVDAEDGDEDPTITALESKIAELEQRLEQRDQTDEQRAQAERVRAAEEAIESELKALHDHAAYPVNEETGEPDDELIARMALPYGGAEDAIQKGFEDYLRITGKAKSELVEEKLDQPGAATRGGRADTTPEEVTSFDKAQELALSRLGGGR